MLLGIGKTNVSSKHVHIYDARSYIKAYSNKFAKGGFENTEKYTNCSLVFCNIENIHGVRDAFNKLTGLLSDQHGSSLEGNGRFLSQLESTGWLQLLSVILQSANSIVDTIRVSAFNAVDCSR